MKKNVIEIFMILFIIFDILFVQTALAAAEGWVNTISLTEEDYYPIDEGGTGCYVIKNDNALWHIEKHEGNYTETKILKVEEPLEVHCGRGVITKFLKRRALNIHRLR